MFMKILLSVYVVSAAFVFTMIGWMTHKVVNDPRVKSMFNEKGCSKENAFSNLLTLLFVSLFPVLNTFLCIAVSIYPEAIPQATEKTVEKVLKNLTKE